MKKKNIFLTILCALCIISSCIVTSFYPNVSTATPTKLPETLEQNLTAFILAKNWNKIQSMNILLLRKIHRKIFKRI